jgi:hypothetical protein
LLAKVEPNLIGMIASCYFWKWADNNLSGKPNEVHAALLRGELHPAVQTFDARPVLTAIEAMANASPAEERDEWEWLAEPAKKKQKAIFVLLNCPRPPVSETMHKLLARQLLRLDVTCFDEALGMLGDCFPPKLTELKRGQWPGEMLYDITADELPVLLRQTDPSFPNPYTILSDRRTHFVQCLRKSKGYVVEWRENDIHDFRNFNQWRAQDVQKLAALKVPYTRGGIAAAKDPDLHRYADTLNIFRAFLLQQSRPARYHWMKINHWLK